MSLEQCKVEEFDEDGVNEGEMGWKFLIARGRESELRRRIKTNTAEMMTCFSYSGRDPPVFGASQRGVLIGDRGEFVNGATI